MVTKPKSKPAQQQSRQVTTSTKPPETQKSTAVATRQEANVPAYLQERLESDAGKGTSTDQEHNLVPMIYVLQGLSPQTQPGNPKRIEGAQQGMLWLRNAPEEIELVGEEGVLFQPCAFWQDFVEWAPNRGGFVARHARMPSDAEFVEEEGENGKPRKVWRRPNGNSVADTRNHAGFIYIPGRAPLPYVIPLTSTGISVSRAWMFAMNGEQVNGVTMPSFAVQYRLSTLLRQKDNLSWYVLNWKKEGYVTEEEYEMGLSLHNAFAAGEKRVEEFEETGEHGEHSDAASVDGKI
jgi:hypothetical protein